MKKVSENDDPFAVALRKRSGKVSTSDPLVSFLYVLMRDVVTPGQVEYIILQLAAEDRVVGDKKIKLTNGWLAKYAKDVAARLQGKIKYNPVGQVQTLKLAVAQRPPKKRKRKS